MRITHLGHATLLVEAADVRILIDPGAVTSDWHGLTGLDAILVTHRHPDHLDPGAVPALVDANPGARVLVEPGIVAAMGSSLPTFPAQPFAADETVVIGRVTLTGVGGRHALIHPDIPVIGNVGMLVRAEGEPSLFHPGDSFAVAPGGVDVLALPGFGPWGTLGDVIDFARGFGTARAVPIHDGLLSPMGRRLFLDRVGDLTDVTILDLAGAPATEL